MNLVICEGIISKAALLGVRPSYINRCSLVQSLSSCAARHFARSSLMACACSFLRLLLSFTRSLLPCGLRWIWVFVSWCALFCFGYLFLSIARNASRLFNCPPCCKLYLRPFAASRAARAACALPTQRRAFRPFSALAPERGSRCTRERLARTHRL